MKSVEAPAAIGFVGLGNMGHPMVARLAAAGYAVTGFDVVPEAVRRLAATGGFRPAARLADVARDAEAVIVMLPDSDAVESVLMKDGLLDAIPPGAALVDMSSSDPIRTRELAVTVASAGVCLVDAPVSGGVRGAETGNLTVMAGGPEDAVEALRPLLSVLGSRVLRAGPVGAGHAVKALNNLMSATHLLATSEALLAARAFGLDLDTVLDIVNGSSGRSGSTEQKWPNFVLTDTYDSGFKLQLMVKDMRIASAIARAMATPFDLGDAAVSLWSSAADQMPPASDHTEIVRWLEDR